MARYHAMKDNPTLLRAFAVVRVRRADMPAGGVSIAAVERTL